MLEENQDSPRPDFSSETAPPPAPPALSPASPDRLAQAKHALRARDLDARRAAVDVLEELRAVPELIETLQDNEHWFIRMAAAQALGRLSDSRAIPFLLQVLHQQQRSDKWLAFDAAVALAQIGTPEALAALHDFREHLAAQRASAEGGGGEGEERAEGDEGVKM